MSDGPNTLSLETRLGLVQQGCFNAGERHWALIIQDARAEISRLNAQVEATRKETIEVCAALAASTSPGIWSVEGMRREIVLAIRALALSSDERA